MVKFIVPALLAFAGGTLSFGSFVLYSAVQEQGEIKSGMGEMRANIGVNSKAAAEAIDLGREALSMLNTHVSEPYHEGVPRLIIDAIRSSALRSELTELSADRNRLGRIVNGYTMNEASPEDDQAYLDTLQDIDAACAELLSLGSTHRVCNSSVYSEPPSRLQ